MLFLILSMFFLMLEGLARVFFDTPLGGLSYEGKLLVYFIISLVGFLESLYETIKEDPRFVWVLLIHILIMVGTGTVIF